MVVIDFNIKQMESDYFSQSLLVKVIIKYLYAYYEIFIWYRGVCVCVC